MRTDRDRVGREFYGPAKVACEQACRAAVGGRLLVARAGLIGGPGDASCPSGAWVARAARAPERRCWCPTPPTSPPRSSACGTSPPGCSTAENRGITGTYDAVGPVVPFGEWVTVSRAIAGRTGPVVLAPAAWLLEHGVGEYMGEDSMAMWLADLDNRGWSSRSGAAALAAGLRHRPRKELLRNVLEWEREQGLDRPRAAGLSAAREQELLTTLQQRHR